MHCLIVGGTGAVGSGLIEALLASPPAGNLTITATHRHSSTAPQHPAVHWRPLDATDEAEVAALAAKLEPVTWLINAAGALHNERMQPEKALRQCTAASLHEAITLNTVPALLLAKHFGGRLSAPQHSGLTPIFAAVSARVGSIGDNRLGGWHSYRASKAALNMILKGISIEWQRTRPAVCVAALHPGTTRGALSAPYTHNVAPDKLFEPAQTGGYLLTVLQRLAAADTGRFWAWDGEVIPW